VDIHLLHLIWQLFDSGDAAHAESQGSLVLFWPVGHEAVAWKMETSLIIGTIYASKRISRAAGTIWSQDIPQNAICFRYLFLLRSKTDPPGVIPWPVGNVIST
jgi:hypothetical protein